MTRRISSARACEHKESHLGAAWSGRSLPTACEAGEPALPHKTGLFLVRCNAHKRAQALRKIPLHGANTADAPRQVRGKSRRTKSCLSPCCGPTQLNTHSEGFSDHGDTHDSVFSGLPTFLPRRIDSVETVQRYCSQCLRALVGVTEHPKKHK